MSHVNLPSPIPSEQIISKASAGNTPLILFNNQNRVAVLKYLNGSWESSPLRGLPTRITEGKKDEIYRRIHESAFYLEGPFVMASGRLPGGGNLPPIDVLQNGQRLQAWIKEHSEAKDLKPSGIRMGHEGIQAITYALKSSNIKILWMDSCELGSKGIELFANGLPNLPVTWVDLQRNQMGGKGLRALAPQLSKSVVTNLNLSHNGISENAIAPFAEELPMMPLRILHLEGNILGVIGTKALAEGLPGSSVMSLNLNGCKAGDNGLIAFSKVLSETALNTLRLDYNGITDQGIKDFAPALKGSGITSLSLKGNQIGTTGIQDLINHLRGSWVTSVQLEGNLGLNEYTLNPLREVLAANLQRLKQLFGGLKDKKPEIKQMLIDGTVPLNLIDHENNTPLHIVMHLKDYALAEHLVKHGAVQAFNKFGTTPKSIAERKKDPKMVNILEQENLEQAFSSALQKGQNKRAYILGKRWSLSLMEQGDFAKAETVIRKLERVCDAYFGSESEEKGFVFLRSASCLLHMGQKEKAIQLGQRAGQIFSQTSSPIYTLINGVIKKNPGEASLHLDKLDLQGGKAQDVLFFLDALDQTISVSHLMLGNNLLGENENLFPLLTRVKEIRFLSLWKNRLQDKHASNIVKLLQSSPNISTVNLADNNLSFSSVTTFLPSLRSVKHLELWGNELSDQDVTSLLRSLETHSSLTTLKLGRMGSADIVTPSLAELFRQNKRLFEVNISFNYATSFHYGQLAQALKGNYSCTHLGEGYPAQVTQLLTRNQNHQNAFFKAASSGDLVKCQNFFTQGVPLHIRNPLGNTPIHVATAHSQYAVLSFLAEKGEKEPLNFSNQTPLDIAKLRSDYHAITILGGSAVPKIPSKPPQTPLFTRSRMIPKHIIDEQIKMEEIVGIEAFKWALSGNLRAIRATQLQGSPQDWAIIKELLSKHSSLIVLDVRDNHLDKAAVEALIEGTEACSLLRTLNFSQNRGVAAAIPSLNALVSRHPTLQELYLSDCNLGEVQMKKLAPALQTTSSLRKLCLNKNNLGHQGIRALSDALNQGGKLYQLELCGALNQNSLGALPELIHAPTVKYLDLSDNPLNLTKGSPIEEALSSEGRLVFLGLRNINPTNRDIAGLSVALISDPHIMHLDLRGNSLSPDCLQDLINFTKQNNAIKNIQLDAPSEALTQELQVNQTCHQQMVEAAQSQNLFLVKKLAEKGISINATDNNFNTSLHYAAQNGDVEMASWFIDRGALQLLNRQGELPGDVAAKYHHHEVSSLFSKTPQTLLATTVDSQVQQVEEVQKLTAMINQLENKISGMSQQVQSLTTYGQPGENTQVQSELALLKNDLQPMIEESRRQKLFEQKLSELFALDQASGDRSLQNFYDLARSRLTAHVIGVFSASSGYFEFSTSVKEDLGNALIEGLMVFGEEVLTAAGAFTPGAGVAGALISHGIQGHQSKKKESKFKKLTDFYKGDWAEIDKQNRLTAYAMTYLFQAQIPLCTPSAHETIIDYWIREFTRQISRSMKKSSAIDIKTLGNALTKMINKTSLKTYNNLGWTTEGLFSRAGISYPAGQGLNLESAYSQDKPLTRADKYGYLQFPSPQEAEAYKQGWSTSQKPGVSWRQDLNAQGNQYT